jgi:hypothetical protein
MHDNSIDDSIIPFQKTDFFFMSYPGRKLACVDGACYNEPGCDDVTDAYVSPTPDATCASDQCLFTKYKKQICANKLLYNKIQKNEINMLSTSKTRYMDLVDSYNNDISQIISNMIGIVFIFITMYIQ